MNAESAYHNLIHQWGVLKFHILQVDSLLAVEWIKKKSHNHVYKQTMWGKMSMQMYGYWCVLLGLLLFILGFPLKLETISGFCYI